MTKRGWWIVGASAGIIILVASLLLWRWQLGDRETEPEAAPSPTPSATVTPTPTPTGPPVNEKEYDAGDYPVVDVFMVNQELPVDEAPADRAITSTSQPRAETGAPVFADPSGDPVAWLPQQQRYGGTIVPVVEEHEDWVKVLLVGRQAKAGEGDAGQLSGWMRMADVELAPIEAHVEVDLEARTVDLVSDTGRETVSTDFAWGTAATPTPTGRSFVMMTETTSFAYTRGHPIVYLSVQSPTLAGFGGQDVAITAFHYHDARSGEISNGCIRVSAETITRLAELPPGTPVYIS